MYSKLSIASLHLLTLLLLQLPSRCCSWSPQSQPPIANAKKSTKRSHTCDRRNAIIQSFFHLSVATSLVEARPASASNLPASTGADISKVGTIETLLPIVSLRASVSRLQSQLTNREVPKFDKLIPTNEIEFKRLFDAYSDPVSYKQKFLDQNAFLVYYTKGFDGPGRANIEEDINARQTLQFGARNEAWISWDNFLVELKFIDDPDNDLDMYLKAITQAVDSYLKLAPPEDIKSAQQVVGVTW